ncbi:MAG: TrkA family potassium uptake protein [Elainellaceae cyanobacterium]
MADYVVVVGCGRLGSLLASRLSGEGNSVVVIDENESAFGALTGAFSGFQIEGDATELATLETAKIAQADCLLAVTDQDNINIMVAQIAKSIFNVPTVLARVFDPKREQLYGEFGIETISPNQLSADCFFQTLEARKSAVRT